MVVLRELSLKVLEVGIWLSLQEHVETRIAILECDFCIDLSCIIVLIVRALHSKIRVVVLATFRVHLQGTWTEEG
jgi:hypothetical protein